MKNAAAKGDATSAESGSLEKRKSDEVDNNSKAVHEENSATKKTRLDIIKDIKLEKPWAFYHALHFSEPISFNAPFTSQTLKNFFFVIFYVFSHAFVMRWSYVCFWTISFWMNGHIVGSWTLFPLDICNILCCLLSEFIFMMVWQKPVKTHFLFVISMFCMVIFILQVTLNCWTSILTDDHIFLRQINKDSSLVLIHCTYKDP